MESCYAEYQNNYPTISVATKDLALIYEGLGLNSEKKQILTSLFSGTREYVQLNEECSKRLAGSFDCEVLAPFFNRARDNIEDTNDRSYC
jgi:hypothetical protein